MMIKIKNSYLTYTLNNKKYYLNIKGIIKDDHLQPTLYYYTLPDKIAVQCVDFSTCLVYVQNKEEVQPYLKQLSSKYKGVCLVYEQFQSYFELIKLFKKVSFIFIFLSFMIAVVLMGYMILSMFYENQKTYALMLANGYQDKYLALFILKKVLLTMMIIGSVSCLISNLFLKIITLFDISNKVFGIVNLFVLPEIYHQKYMLYVFYFLGYILQGFLLSGFMLLKMKKIKIYECLREE